MRISQYIIGVVVVDAAAAITLGCNDVRVRLRTLDSRTANQNKTITSKQHATVAAHVR